MFLLFIIILKVMKMGHLSLWTQKTEIQLSAQLCIPEVSQDLLFLHIGMISNVSRSQPVLSLCILVS